MKFILTLIYFFFVFISFSTAQKLSGTEVKKTYYPNGVLKTEGDYWYGQLNGEYVEYYPNGKVWKQWHFEDGLEEGLSNMVF
ncbi:MAG: hypothetical protein IPH11_17215 [Ignavibacteriales bacterium]|nr:hypothetical protein [Ignavibacteriales bacterium]